MAPKAPHPDVLIVTTRLMTKVTVPVLLALHAVAVPVLPAIHAITVPVLHALHAIAVPVLRALHAIAVEVALATCKTVLVAAAINATPPTPPPMTTNLANAPSAGMSIVIAAIRPLLPLKKHIPARPKGGDLIAGRVQTTMMTVHHACVCHQSGRDRQHPYKWNEIEKGPNRGYE